MGGEAVNAVVREFQLRPPQILQITDEGLKRIQQSLTTNSSNKSTATTSSNNSYKDTSSPPDYDSLVGMTNTNAAPLPDVQLPDIPHHFIELDGKDREELQSILDDELEFLTVRNQISVFQQMDQQASTILEENVVIAKQNMEKQEQLKELHSSVQELQDTLKQKVTKFQKLEQEQIKLCAPPDTQQVMKQLQKGRKSALDETEEMANDWVDSGGDVDTFMKEFIAQRTIHHSRAAKIERLQQQQLQMNGTSGHRGSANGYAY